MAKKQEEKEEINVEDEDEEKDLPNPQKTLTVAKKSVLELKSVAEGTEISTDPIGDDWLKTKEIVHKFDDTIDLDDYRHIYGEYEKNGIVKSGHDTLDLVLSNVFEKLRTIVSDKKRIALMSNDSVSNFANGLIIATLCHLSSKYSTFQDVIKELPEGSISNSGLGDAEKWFNTFNNLLFSSN